ncbi:DUF5615 family PIN-like protein [Thermococcus aciditolerans]|uniref:DUF5615 domain-containing protein n=1 Tax=Thermococcus aciditolerans TaxID=2598455 RepID=A0A5C0SP48_9EURY|nr:DUF5615 family PIN-like protein [Thermococcus aciditolerans]QEK14958.1 hypothetical protein FPV09_07495 [Thermococcus aciditolerans]
MRYLLDENIPFSLYKELQKKYDVRRVQEIRRGLPDGEVLRIARKEERILVTLDKDFARLQLASRKVTVVLIDIHPPTPWKVTELFVNNIKIVEENLGKLILMREDKVIVL